VISADTDAEITFLTEVFGALETPGARIMTDGRVNHAEVTLAGSTLLLFDSGSGWSPTPAHLRVYVDDLRRVLAAAAERGARVVTEPADMPFGDVVGRFRDPQGHLWWVHEHVEDVAVDEMMRRFGEPVYQQAMAVVGDTLVAELGPG
jgi:uncharacterized glyoxalase superfamily protein PhnB